MLNKKDPLIDAIQQVMQSNQADRDAVKAVNEKFGIQDRRVLPHERQGEWDTAYQTVLTEGVEALDEKVHPSKYSEKQRALAGTAGNKRVIDGPDLTHVRKHGGQHIGEEGDPSKAIRGDVVTGGSSVTTVPKPKPKPTSITPEQQNVLKKKIQSIKEAKKAAMCEDTLQEKAAAGFVQQKQAAASAKPAAPASAMSGSQSRDMPGTGPGQGPGAPQQRTAGGKVDLPASRQSRDMPGTGPGQGPGAPQQRTVGGKVDLPPGVSASPKPKSPMSGQGSASLPKSPMSGQGSASPPPKSPMSGQGSASLPKSPMSGQGSASPPPKSPMSGQGSASPPPKSPMSGQGTSGARPTMSGSQARIGGNPTAAPAARPAVGGARPSVVAKNSYSGAQTSTGNQVGGARPSVVAKNSPSQKSYQSGAGAMTNPTQRPYDAKTSPTAKATTQSGAKPVQKLKPVRKQPTQPTTGTAQSPNVAAKPKRPQTRYQRDNGIGGNGKPIKGPGGVTTGNTIRQKATVRVKRTAGTGSKK